MVRFSPQLSVSLKIELLKGLSFDVDSNVGQEI